MADHGHGGGGHETVASGSTNDGRFLDLFKDIVKGTSEFTGKAIGENTLNAVESAHEFMPGITKGGSTGGDSHSAH